MSSANAVYPAPSPFVQRVARFRNLAVVAVVLVLAVVLSFASSSFLTTSNLTNILDQWSDVGIIACAGTLVVVAGNFDLSVAAIFSVSGVLAAKWVGPLGVWPAFAAATTAGVALGLVNGVIVNVFRINSIISTLATGIVFGGFALALSGGNLITAANPDFMVFGTTEWFSVPLTVYAFAAFALVVGLLLSRSVFGRYVYASGGNDEASRMSGVRVSRVRVITYMISGLAAGFAGVMIASKVGSGQANAAPGIEINAIAAIVVGGTSILGGSGAVWRTVVGVLLLGLIQNGSNLINISSNYQAMIYGGIILVAAGVDVWARRADARR